MKIWISFLTIQFFISSLAFSQMERFRIGSKYPGLNLKPEISLLGGISVPGGEFAALTDRLSDKGAAKQGYFGELRLMHRPMTHPLWSLGLHIGHMRHEVAKEEIFETYQLATFTASDWSSTYIMPAFCFRGGTNIKFELGVAAGALVFQGWDALRGEFGKNQVLEVDEWSFETAVGAAVKMDAALGIKVHRRWIIYFYASQLFGRGQREGDWVSSHYETDPGTLLPFIPPVSSTSWVVQDKVVFAGSQFAAGIKYDFYKNLYDPNQKYWDYY